MGLRTFFRLLRSPELGSRVGVVDDSLARTAKDVVHFRAPGGSMGGGSMGGYGSTDGVYQRIAEGHKNYAKSFKKKGD